MCRKSIYHNIIDYKTINSYNYEKILMRRNQQWQRTFLGKKAYVQKEGYMSKYDNLWNWIRENGKDSFKLTYEEVEKIAGLPLDHSFLKYKKELIDYGYEVVKISMKEQTVTFRRIEP